MAFPGTPVGHLFDRSAMQNQPVMPPPGIGLRHFFSICFLVNVFYVFIVFVRFMVFVFFWFVRVYFIFSIGIVFCFISKFHSKSDSMIENLTILTTALI